MPRAKAMRDVDGKLLRVGDTVEHWLEGWNGHKPRRAKVLHVVTRDLNDMVLEKPYVILQELTPRCTQTQKLRHSEHVRRV